MKNFEVIIGIEVHTVLNTKTKMFSSSKSCHYSNPNTNINPIDLALPGVMPQPNINAIKKAIWLASELHMDINYKNIQFDRKNYFYIDLPKGYQITQQYFPIGQNGYIEIENESQNIKQIEIERIHLEEDTVKQFSENKKIFLDYNRAGMPLIEIVTKPVISSGYEAQQYLRELVKILKFANVSDAKLEDGSLRADVNISLRPYGQKEFGNKVEIKNINSINNVKKAIDYEISRQSQLLLTGNVISQETRRFDDSLNLTVHMREKTNAINYRYIHEPNIMRISLSDDQFTKIMSEKNLSLNEIIVNLKENKLEDSIIQQLINDYDFYTKFKLLTNEINDYNLCFKWLGIELIGLLKKDNKSYIDITDDLIRNLSLMIKLLIEQEINGKQAKVILECIYKENKNPHDIIKELGFEQIKDPKIIRDILIKHIEANPEMLQSCYDRPERGEKFFIGMLMKDTNGQANPVISYQILKDIINEKK